MKTYNRKLIPFAQQMRREMTRAEARLWFELLRDFLPRVRRQRPFGRFIVDFYCSACKVVIEVDGAQHFSPEGLVADAERTAFLAHKTAPHGLFALLEGLGLRVVRFSNVDVLENLDGVGLRLFAVLKEPERLNHD
jgi:very-short-patch-repair endonuclease